MVKDIAVALQKELLKDSFVPGPEIQQMRQYNRRRFALNRNQQRAEQSLDPVLQRCNIRLSNYVSDIGGKSMRNVIKALSQGETDTDKLVTLIRRRIIFPTLDFLTSNLKPLVSFKNHLPFRYKK